MRAAAVAVPYLAAVVAANLLVNHYGPQAAPLIALVAVAAVLIFRDRFADLVGSKKRAQIAQVALIAAGAALTYAINQNARLIAEASTIAFACSELVEQTGYFLLRERPWLVRAPWSAVPGAVVDSALFISIAFGFNLWVIGAQVGCKIGGAWLWASLIDRTRSDAVLSRHA